MASKKNIKIIIDSILEKIVAKYHPQKVILFGSYAYGEPRPDSDLDLLIIKDTNERFLDRWIQVRGILSDPSRKIPLETLVLTPDEISRRLERGDQFIESILNNGKVLYAS